MITTGDIAEFLNGLFPPEMAEDFDNVGLLIGSPLHKVKRVMIMLDADSDTICEAIKNRVDLIITHHPFIFSPIKRIDDSDVLTLIENKIALFSAHTNLDSCVFGVNDNLAKLLSLSDVRRESMPGCNLVAVTGIVEAMTLESFIAFLKQKLKIDAVRYTGEEKLTVKKVGIIGGCGTDFIDEMKRLCCDVFVTADLKYHQAQYACKIGMSIIDAGHFETENHICLVVKELLNKRFKDLEVLISQRKKSYIKYG